MDGYGLILGGGGAMGSYEIGVWKALRDLNIKIDAIAGTSVGAINGAIILQEDFDKALYLWKNITIDQIIDVDINPLNKGLLQWKKDDFTLFFDFFKDFIKEKGLDTKPLRKILEDNIDEDRIRNTNKVLGINTYSITDRQPVELYLDQIPEGELVSFLMASACLPIFQVSEINNKKYVDGGLYNNLPIDLLIRKGYTKLIAVELLPFNNKLSEEIPEEVDKLKIITIKSSSSLGKIMEFTPRRAEANIRLGYKDTMKTFKLLDPSC